MIRNIEHKQKIVLIVAIISIVASVIISFGSYGFAYRQIKGERNKIYVLDNGVPLLVERVDASVNRKFEYETAVNIFHTLFFTLPPDEDYIEKNINRAMYLVDNTGVLEYNNLKEKGYYNQIMSSSAVLSIMTDSIVIDMNTNAFDFYGKQRIDRRSKVLHRSIHTSGKLSDAPRTENNPLGVIITDWRTVENKDLYSENNVNF